MGNPPYSIGQKSAHDDTQNLQYPNIDKRIADTYVKFTEASLKKSLYDSYIKAFLWVSDHILQDKGLFSNGAWLDSSAGSDIRRCFEEKFTSIYVLNLRGNQRTLGKLSRKERGKFLVAVLVYLLQSLALSRIRAKKDKKPSSITMTSVIILVVCKNSKR